jgi:formylglycine-generating enzyme required for sulfatase activity
MVRIAGATLRMGSTAKGAEPNEGPVHDVAVRGFWLDRTEVTVGAYRACVSRGACAAPKPSSPDCTYDKGEDRAAMSCVSFAEADRFCVAHGRRLPTEAEWELAARPDSGRLSEPNDSGHLYPWGTAPPSCETFGTFRFHPCPGGRIVGGRPAGRSPAGIDDLGGNLQEWVNDFYDDRHVVGIPLPQGVAHVLRGGHYRTRTFSEMRFTARSWGSQAERGPTTGFRCARDEL